MRSLPAYLRPLWLVLIVALGCSGDPTGPSAVSLTVSVLGLPGGSSAAITVTGPGGFSQSVTATQTFTQLTRGTYTIAATNVTVGTSEYQPSPQTQTIVVNGSAKASVTYALVTGSLAVTINGLGTTGSAAVTVTGSGYSRPVGATTTLTGLTPGSYLVTASNATAAGGTTHTPNPPSQTVSVVARTTSNATVNYTPPPNDGMYNLHVAGFYVTQSAQSYGGSIPLVTNRPGLLRVFVVSDEANTPAPIVRARFFDSLGVQVDSANMVPQGSFAPTAVDESSVTFSWNVPVSKALIKPGMGIQIVVDPGDLVSETNEGDNVYPASLPQAMTVHTVPVLNLSFVPIVQSGRTGNTSNTDTLLSFTRRMHPLDSINVLVRLPFVTSWVLQADGTGWTNVLSELDVARVAAADARYWYGVVNVSYPSGVAGIAYVTPGASNPQKTAMGWDDPGTGGKVAAHELGHNWTRNHAPCGNPAGIDPQYPQADGTTAGYGWDRMDGTLQPASSKDIMGYCDPRWISDYTYGAVLNYLSPVGSIVLTQAAPSVQPCLLVWGHIRDGEMVLEPAFQVNTRPSLPEQSGPYSIVAQAHDGSTLFSYSFAPREVADAQQTQQNFTFAIPLPATKAAQLSSLRLTGGGRPAVAQLQAAVQPDSVQLRQVSGGRLALRWNARANPMVMVRDPQTGQVLSLARGGSVELPGSKRQVDLLLSNGVKSQLKRIRVTR
jgi:reprolysin-like metallo-peptidase family M12B